MGSITSRAGKRVTSGDLRKEDSDNAFMREAGIHGMGSGKAKKLDVVTPGLDRDARKKAGNSVRKSTKKRGNGDPTCGP